MIYNLPPFLSPFPPSAHARRINKDEILAEIKSILAKIDVILARIWLLCIAAILCFGFGGFAIRRPFRRHSHHLRPLVGLQTRRNKNKIRRNKRGTKRPQSVTR
ncbi:MAG: hypothetical protein IJV24_07670 [Prevotella sp.]|nr:hypothetical protein [Prevotella sp.]